MSPREAGASADVVSLEEAAGARRAPWQADVYPLPCHISDNLQAIPVFYCVCGEGAILFGGGDTSPGGEPEAVAAFLEQAVVEAVATADRSPAVLEVRHEEVALHLGERLARLGIEVRKGSDLEHTNAVARLAIVDLTGKSDLSDLWPPTSTPMTWAAWGHPPRAIAQLFRAASRYLRAAPWRGSEFSLIQRITVPGGRRWNAVPLGAMGTSPGLELIAEDADLAAISKLIHAEGGEFHPLGPVLSLTFRSGGDQPSPMRREVALAGWKVAGPVAYPMLAARSTPGAGISARDLADLTEVLLSMARRAKTVKDVIPPQRWVDRESGVVIERGEMPPLPGGSGAWDDSAELHPGGALGAGADLSARARPSAEGPGLLEQVDVVARFAVWLIEQGADKDPEVFERAVIDARWLLGTLEEHHAPLCAIHECDVRSFLFAYPTGFKLGAPEVASVLASLRSFFDFLAAKEGIECRWVDPILEDHQGYEALALAIGSAMSERKVQDRRALKLLLGMQFKYLEDRGFRPPVDLEGDIQWRDDAGPQEAALERELEAHWLIWREELIAGGVSSPTELVERLARRRGEWATTPHPSHGRTPVEVVRKERRG